MIPNIGPTELIIVLVIAVIILGPKRIPEAAKSIGKGIRGFKDTVGGEDDAPKLEKDTRVKKASKVDDRANIDKVPNFDNEKKSDS